jgi:putative SOS response-associated peptidase YedK
LTAEGARNWINPDLDTAQLHELLAEERHANYDAWPIATRAGSPSNDDAAIMERIETD